MLSLVELPCPKCKAKIRIDFQYLIFLARDGSELLCQNCKELIPLHFKGKAPKQQLEDIKKEFAQVLKKV